MTKRMRTLAAVALTFALLVAALAANPRTTTAANLTGGNYTYLVDGEEFQFTFDPVVRKDGLLLPVEVFEQFGITVDGAQGTAITLTKENVVAKLTLGTTSLELAGPARTVSTAPLRLNGRLFLPSDLLKEFGVDMVQDGQMIIMKTYLDQVSDAVTLTDAQWNTMRPNRGFQYNVKSDAGVALLTDFILMDSVLVNATNLGVSYGTRAKLNSLLATNTLVYVKLSNLSTRAGGLATAGIYLVDDQRRQYEVQQVVDIGYGLLTSKLAPGADRVGVLVYPKVQDGATKISVYADSNQTTVGTFPVIK